DLVARLRLQQGAEPFEHVEEVGGEAGLGVALLLLRQDRHRQLGEVFERQVIEPALLGQQDGRVEVVAPEAAAVANANAVHVRSSSVARSRWSEDERHCTGCGTTACSGVIRWPEPER